MIAMEPELAKIHAKIASDYQSVEHIDADAFETLTPEDTIVFDVREPGEYNVSHIAAAHQVDPSIDADEFLELYGDDLKGKTLVFYCSVGRRSSLLAERVDEVVEATGAEASYNLIGGVFQWHNEDRPLMTGSAEETTAIHPYNSHWGRLIKDKSAISYAPQSSEQ